MSHPMATINTPINHLTVVRIGTVLVAFSYATPIAFLGDDDQWVIRANDWSNTTGRHMAWLESSNASDLAPTRFPSDWWLDMFKDYIREHTT